MIEQMWNYIKIRFKTKLTIFAVVFFGASFFNIIPYQFVKVPCLLLTLLFIPVMAVVLTLDSIKNIGTLVATVFKKKIIIDAPIEVLALAEKIGVKCKQFKIVQNFNNACVTPTGDVFIGDELILSHSKDELLGIFAHEFGHHKKKHLLKRILTLVLILLAGYLALNQLPEIIMMYAFLAFVSIAIIPFNWDAEFEADRIAKESGLGEALISALEKLSKDCDQTEGSETHPPINKRIKLLQS